MRCFSRVWTHFEASENSEGIPGVGWHAQPSEIVCYFDFLMNFCWIFVVFCLLFTFGSVREPIGVHWGAKPSAMFDFKFSLKINIIYFAYCTDIPPRVHGTGFLRVRVRGSQILPAGTPWASLTADQPYCNTSTMDIGIGRFVTWHYSRWLCGCTWPNPKSGVRPPQAYDIGQI